MALLVFLSVIFIIIGLPLYMVGCDDKIGGYCNGFIKQSVTVINNQCYLTSGYVHHGKTSDDDGIGFNCNVHVQYTEHDKNVTCPVYRSDDDHCTPLVITWKQVDTCNKLNNKDYPLGKIFNIYINKVDGRCETHHYVQKYAVVGFVFLMISSFLILCKIINVINYKNEQKYEQTTTKI